MSVDLGRIKTLLDKTKLSHAYHRGGSNLHIYNTYSKNTGGASICCIGGDEAAIITWAVNNVRELVGELDEHRESLDLRACKCVGCEWRGQGDPIDLCPDCGSCLEIED